MESKANYSLVGLISLLVMFLTGGFIYWFAILDSNVTTNKYNVVFTGTVTGLSVSTPVLFNGIKIGQVRSVAIDPNDPGKVIASVEVDSKAPIKTDTKAILEFQGLTGVAYVQFSGGSPTANALPPSTSTRTATILADKSDFQSILDGLQDTIVGASVAFDRLNNFLDDNEATTSTTLANVEAFSAALAANSDGVEQFLASLAGAGKEIGPLSAELRQFSEQLRGIIGDIEPGQVAKIIEDASKFSEAISRNSDSVDSFFDDAVALSASLNKSSEQIGQITQNVETITNGIDPETVKQFIENIGAISSVLEQNKGNLESFMGNMTTVSDELTISVAQVRSIVDAIDKMANGAGDEGLFEQFSTAAAAIQSLAENLDTRTSTIATGLNKFTSGGLSEYQALASDARATLRRLDNVLAKVERNPQGIIFGGDTVREYTKQ
ncbi:MlaD family protein [Maritalea porphyrae]|jgi:phospholipid/cholesterol/gamma-HCH transport system substrate-binding protein|uniref:MlaD family protein n=1 Tax=Maritalea porphyrae TaxID=880732 RepID=UPI0022B06E8A|nr:MlaD family protein [Maritalea porphyrae]MCZ4273459.1 MlaD family protein [Maritalea porphyrae]